MTLTIGDKAPAFTLKGSDLKDVSLSDYSGSNVVLMFFPLAFSGTCTQQLCYLRDNQKEFDQLDSQILTISVDSPYALARYKSDNNFKFSVLSDFNKEVSRAYEAYYEDFELGLKGVSKRASFVIGRDGSVKYCEVLENAGNLPNFESIKQTLSHLQ